MAETRKLLAMDLDGTIVDSRHVMRPDTVAALQALRQRGHVICYVTGRRGYDMDRVPYQYDCADYVLLNTGTCAVEVSTGRELFHLYVDPAAAEQLIDACVRNGWQLYVICDDGYGLNIVTEGSQDYARSTGLPPRIFSGSGDFDLRHIQGFMVSRDRESIIGYISACGLPLNAVCSEPECYDITPDGVGKWYAVERLAEQLAIPVRNIVAMGNWLNDLEMVQRAGIGVAVGDAIEELRRAADYVTARTHDEDAVLDVCRHCFGVTAEEIISHEQGEKNDAEI